jgi:heparanase 1
VGAAASHALTGRLAASAQRGMGASARALLLCAAAAQAARGGAAVAVDARLVFALLPWAVVARAPAGTPSGIAVNVAVNDAAAVISLDDLYLGYNIDSGSLYHNIDLGNPTFVQLAKNLAPAQLRVGGSASDAVWYVPDAPEGDTQGPSPDPLSPGAAQAAAPGFTGYVPQVTIMDDTVWRGVTGFATAAGMQLLWDFNAVDFRTPAGAWNPAGNATALLAYTAANNLAVSSWELGNEPDIWNHHYNNMVVSGTQIADDLRTLQKTLASYPGLSTAVSGPSLATYNAAMVQSFLQEWTATGGGPLSFTAHAYPLGPPTYPPNSSRPSCSVANYLNLTRVNGLSSYLGEFSAAVAQFGDPATTRMVLEETASNSLGGCVGYSDRFISGFYFVNLLGLVGEAGWNQVNRQDLAGMSFTAAGSQYTLFGPPGWTNGSGLVSATSPHPDYFTALLWTRLMGKTVLNNSVTGGALGEFAAHAWCAADTAPGATSGALTLAYVVRPNTHACCRGCTAAMLTAPSLRQNACNVSVSVSLTGSDGSAMSLSPRSEFFLTSLNLTGACARVSLLLCVGTKTYDESRLTRHDAAYLMPDSSVYLNLPPNADKMQRAAARLSAHKDGTVPKELLHPKGRRMWDEATSVLVPPLSYGFIVLPNAKALACTGGASPAPVPRMPQWLAHLMTAIALAAAIASASLAVIWRRTTSSRQQALNARLLNETNPSGYGSLL